MINRHGYSKGPLEQPEGIVVTCGAEMIKEKGGMMKFIRWFENCFVDESSYWLHKCKNKPKHDILYVYIIILGKVRYRAQFGGYGRTAMAYLHPEDSEMSEIPWPHLILGGPLVKAPEDIEFKGFQGFRYCSKLF